MQREDGCAVIRQGNPIAVMGAFLLGCVVLVGCSGVRSEAPKEKQEHTKATASEEAQCGGTRTIDLTQVSSATVATIADSSVQPGDPEAFYVTNDLPGCPNGGLLSGTDKSDRLGGVDGEDEVRGLGAADMLSGGGGSDVLYGGPGDDELQGGAGPIGSDPFYDRSKNVLHGGPGRDFLAGAEGDDVIYGGEGDDKMLWGGGGEDALYGGDGNDYLDGISGQRDRTRDKLYCGEGKDEYSADKLDYVDSSCEVEGATGPEPKDVFTGKPRSRP
jgi:Ca2+-binding RTX toxin-like protein